MNVSIDEYQAVGNVVLTEKYPKDNNSEVVDNGIIIPEITADEDKRRKLYKIISFGTSFETEEDINLGDIVIATKEGSSEIKMDEGTYYVLQTDQILAKYSE
jgi:co-chaperonin GroES (HSP10)